jgi:hypothetical protein
MAAAAARNQRVDRVMMMERMGGTIIQRIRVKSSGRIDRRPRNSFSHPVTLLEILS